MRLFLAAFFLAASTLGASAVPQGTPPPGGGGGSLTSGVSPISGCSPGQFLYNNSGVLGCQAGSGGISSPGTTVLGNIAAWNSSTGSALLDTGISLSSQAAGLFLATPSGSSGVPSFRAIVAADLGSYALTPTFAAASISGVLQVTGGVGAITAGTTNISTVGTSAKFFLGAYLQNLYLEGSSTGYDIIQSGNTGTGNWTYKTPPATGTGSDTFVTLAATNAHTGPNSFAGAASGSAANTTTIMGGSTAPTMGANAGFLTVGGLFAAPSITTAGQGAISLSATTGLQLQGKGSTADVSLFNSLGAVALYVKTGTQSVQVQGGLYLSGTLVGAGGHIIASNTAPTFTNAALGVANGSFAFSFVPTASASSVTVTLPAATTGWACQFTDLTTPTTVPRATATTTTAVTVAPYGWTTGTVGTFGAADTVQAICFAY